MSGFHILTPSWTAGATVTASSEATPVVGAMNLLATQPSRKWRSAGLGTLQLTLDAGESKPWDTVALLYHNGFDGTMRATGDDVPGDLFASPIYSSEQVPLRFLGDLSSFSEYQTWFYAGTQQNTRYVGIEIVDNNNPDGYFQSGVVMVGNRFTPKIGAELGARFGRDDPSIRIRLLNGESVVRPKRGYDVGTWKFPKQDQTDHIRWLEIHRVYGSKFPVIFKWDPLEGNFEQHTFYYGHMIWRSGGPFSYVTADPRYDVEVGIEEV